MQNQPHLKPHILLVEDEASFCELLSLYFEHFGWKVTAVATPQQAMDVLVATPFDAIVLDLNLAGEDGLEVLRFAKSKFPDLPVIISTGLEASEQLIKRCLANRADGFMHKRAGLPSLFAEVRRHLATADAA